MLDIKFERAFLLRVDYSLSICLKTAERVGDIDPDQMPYSVASDLGLHCFLRHVIPNT